MAARVVHRHTVDIAAPLERVFELLENPELMKQWITGLEETTYEAGFNPARPIGAQFKQKIREGGRLKEYSGKVTAYEPPRHLAVRLFNEQFAVDVDYQLESLGANRTRLLYEADVQTFTRFAAIMMRLCGWLARRILNRQMARLKKLAEQDTVKA